MDVRITELKLKTAVLQNERLHIQKKESQLSLDRHEFILFKEFRSLGIGLTLRTSETQCE